MILNRSSFVHVGSQLIWFLFLFLIFQNSRELLTNENVVFFRSLGLADLKLLQTISLRQSCETGVIFMVDAFFR